jgi:hypothetical protein
MVDRRLIRFAVILGESFREVSAGIGPVWLQEELPPDELKRIAREAGLPQHVHAELLATALALDKALQTDFNELQPKKVKREISGLQSDLSTVLQRLGSLSKTSRDAIRPDPKRVDEQPDGTSVWESDPDPVDVFRRQIESFNGLLEEVVVPEGTAGRRPSVVAFASLALDSLMVEHGKDISVAQCTKLVEAILAPVRHGVRLKLRFHTGSLGDCSSMPCSSS